MLAETDMSYVITFVPRVKTTYGKNSIYYKGTQIWNSLHALLYTVATLGQFKHLYTKFKYVNVFVSYCVAI